MLSLPVKNQEFKLTHNPTGRMQLHQYLQHNPEQPFQFLLLVCQEITDTNCRWMVVVWNNQAKQLIYKEEEIKFLISFTKLVLLLYKFSKLLQKSFSLSNL